MKKSLGITRNKILLLSEYRRESKSRNSSKIGVGRFSKQRLIGGQIEMVERGEGMKQPFIEQLSTVSTMDSAKPQWMAHLEDCQALLKAVEELRKQMLTNQNKRLSCAKISEQKGYQMKIYDCARQATTRIKRAEMIVGHLKLQAERQTPANSRICKSVCFKLAHDIQQATKQLRGQQKSFIDQRKQFQATEKVSFLQLAVDKMLGGEIFDEQMIEDEAIIQMQSRSQEITKIVRSIFELNEIYKELNQLVVLQGSILDRIDSNIQEATDAIAGGLDHLVKAQKHQKKGNRCACVVMAIQLIAISVLLIILCTKWFK